MLDLSICILTWNTKDLTVKCIESIHNHTNKISYEIILVDNGSADGTEEYVRGNFSDVILIRNNINQGFTKGNNQAMLKATGRYVMILNNDTEIEAGCLDMMVEKMDMEPRVGIGCCKMLYPDRSLYYNVHDMYPSWKNILAERSFVTELFYDGQAHKFFKSMYYITDDNKYGSDRYISWGLGAFLVVRREVIDRIGLLDERFFIYFEEIDWCKRCREAGFNIKYYSEPVVIHHTAKSIIQEYPRMTDVWHTSRLTYFRKHHGFFSMLALKIAVIPGIFVRLFKYSCQIRTGRINGNGSTVRSLEEMFDTYVNILKKVMTYA